MMELTKNDNLIKLIKILNDNPDKAKEFYNMGSSEELYEYCISLVPGYDFDEFVEFMKNVAKISEEDVLSNDELNKVSGGNGLSIMEIFDVAKTVYDTLDTSKNITDSIIKKIVGEDKEEKK